MNSGLKATPKASPGSFPEASIRRGRMTLRVVPGNTVERTTTSCRVDFDRIA